MTKPALTLELLVGEAARFAEIESTHVEPALYGVTDGIYRPVAFDDTVYFLSAHSEAEAAFLEDLLSDRIAQQFYGAMVFWEDKRPITVDLLKRLNLRKLAIRLGRLDEYERHAGAPTESVDLFAEAREQIAG